MTNAVKHSGDNTISVHVVEEDGSILITVRDDGRGFDSEGHTGGFGLLGMRERVELIAGSVFIDSEPGRGTVVRAKLPARHRPSESTVSEAQSPRSADR